MTNSRVMMLLGEFGFGVDTASFSRIQTSTKAKWAAVDRIGINPARQFVGWDQTQGCSMLSSTDPTRPEAG